MVESDFEADIEVAFPFRFSLEVSLFLLVFWSSWAFGVVGFVWLFVLC